MGAIKSRRMFLLLLPLALFSSTSLVSGHGGVLWPPIWQDGHGRPIEELTDHVVYSEPKVRDPNSNRKVWSAKSWLTDQAYTGGWGDEFKGIGPVTNFRNPNARKFDQCNARCANTTQPWAAPGRAPSLGGGCASVDDLGVVTHHGAAVVHLGVALAALCGECLLALLDV